MTVRELMETCDSPCKKTRIFSVESLKFDGHPTVYGSIVEFDGLQIKEDSYLKRIVLNAQVIKWEHVKISNTTNLNFTIHINAVCFNTIKNG